MMKQLLTLAVAVLVAAALAMAEDAPKQEVELQGAIGCGHCTYHQGQHCSVGLKTADGKVYLLEKANADLMKARFDGGQLKVKGTVTEKDGVRYVDAASTEIVK